MRRRVAPIAFGLTAAWLAALCASAQAITLRYTPKVGTKVAYDYTVSSTGETALGGTNGVPMQSTTHMTTTLTVLAKTPQGVRVEMARRNGSLSTSAPGWKSPMTRKLPDRAGTLVLDERGQTQQAGQDPKAAAMSDDLLKMTGFSVLPRKDVKPGDTWSDTLETTGRGAAPAMKMAFTSRLVGLTTRQGRRCAKISTTFKGTMTGAEGPGTGNVQGSAVQYYDYEKSLWVEAEAKMTETITVPPRQTKDGGKTRGSSFVMKSTATTKLKK